MSNSLDDVWGSDSDDDGSVVQESPDFKKLRDIHFKRGYVDGISGSKEAKLQEGFDTAFPLGSRLGMEVGRLIGILQFLDFKYGKDDEELHGDFQLAQKELKIDRVLIKSMFDSDLNLMGEHQVISKWRRIVKVHCNKYAASISSTIGN
ncbi:hypothetical protein ZYGR_0Z00780 [Zygosaccharomyces rouxii]|uniref:Protein YAE1 n=2 Tax=Zygosaccharomyces rouxii TaxID=4956 RepID=C5DZ73_ZYGRC|nr:uncharacterized protein ZYRO0G01980g [Zygosaccharomyces rouxii]KAH9202154.1 hypothetical protein LQ764DRAFT_2272 [Zygosaccharomyces rouxii]GAV50655.1 hypothetical protein ZYGR_0Z00780 [Zygosaccharomyces rouxii]CAR29157.1 ZYRO0G01980p [Zygosaccharomyces rouxii]